MILLYKSYFKFLFCFFLLAGFSKGYSATQVSKPEMKEGYYLVVGVFSSEENASRYSKELGDKGYPTKYEFSQVKKMFYCYVAFADSLSKIKDKYYELRKQGEFYSVWVLKIKNHQETKLTEIEDKPAVASEKPAEEKKHHHSGNQKAGAKPVRDLSATHHSYKVLITVKDEKNRSVPASIQILNGDQSKVLTTIKCNQEGHIHIPKKESQLVDLICEVFGYHKTELALPLGDPIALSALKNVKVEGDKISVDLTLEKVQKGDLMVMFNVFFHPNSNIMRLKSQIDLTTMLQILNENPNLKICIHGHTNGNGGGEIIRIPDDCTDFFNPTNTEKTKGSAVKLSQLRSEAVKMYMVKNGISADRIEVKGWGGKKMIYKEDSPHYQMNVRVEVEVLDI